MAPSPAPPHPLQNPGTRTPPRLLTPPGAGVPRRLGAAEREAAGLAERPAEVLVHHGADVPLEVGEEDAPGADVLSLGGPLLLGAALLLLDAGGGVAGEGAAGAGAAAALRGFLHFGVQGEFLEGERGKGGRETERRGVLAPVPAPRPRARRDAAPGPAPSSMRELRSCRTPGAPEPGSAGRDGRCRERGDARDSAPGTKFRTQRRFAGRIPAPGERQKSDLQNKAENGRKGEKTKARPLQTRLGAESISLASGKPQVFPTRLHNFYWIPAAEIKSGRSEVRRMFPEVSLPAVAGSCRKMSRGRRAGPGRRKNEGRAGGSPGPSRAGYLITSLRDCRLSTWLPAQPLS